MADRTLPAVLQRLLQGRQYDELPDAVLLERFLLHRDETAFTTLYRRHGGMVRGVCRRHLNDAADVDDAVQATFLVLVKSPARIRRHGSLAAWLHGVARRVSQRARSRRARAPEPRGDLNPPDRGSRPGRDDELDLELERLPDRLRHPLVLCYLQGRTVDEAAMVLGWPRGSVAAYLSRGKDLLRQRLLRRGWVCAAVAAVLSAPADAAALPPADLLPRALALLAGQTAAVPAALLSLVQGTVTTMTVTRYLLPLILTLTCCTLGGVAAWTAFAAGPTPAAPTASDAGLRPDPQDKPDYWLRFRQNNTFFLVSPDGKQRAELLGAPLLGYHPDTVTQLSELLGPTSQPHLAYSPDGARIAWIGDLDVDGTPKPHPFFGHVIISSPRGDKATRLTTEPANRRDVCWSPENRWVAWQEEQDRNFVVKVYSLERGRVAFTYGGSTEPARQPAFSPKGRLQYSVERGREGKMPLMDVVVRILDGTMSPAALRPVTLVEKTPLLGAALAPDEMRLAYSRVGNDTEMVLKNLDKPGVEIWSMSEVNRQLPKPVGVVFFVPKWRPDGKQFACRLVFIGGRSRGPGEVGPPPPVAGEELMVVFTPGERTVQTFVVAPEAIFEGWGKMP